MNIETKRLQMIALSPPRLNLWINDISQLEMELCCTYQGEPIEGVFRKILIKQLKIAEEDSGNYPWHSFWLIIRKSGSIVVGSACFKGLPDENGEVEIGYGLGKGHEHNGYMTEAVRALCAWATAQSGVRHIIAETEPGGFASQRILRRNGFAEYLRDSSIWWKL